MTATEQGRKGGGCGAVALVGGGMFLVAFGIFALFVYRSVVSIDNSALDQPSVVTITQAPAGYGSQYVVTGEWTADERKWRAKFTINNEGGGTLEYHEGDRVNSCTDGGNAPKIMLGTTSCGEKVQVGSSGFDVEDLGPV